MASEVKQAFEGNKNPKELVERVMSGFTPYQRQDVLNRARSMGIPSNIIDSLQSMK